MATLASNELAVLNQVSSNVSQNIRKNQIKLEILVYIGYSHLRDTHSM